MKLILNPEFNLYERDGKAFCDSLQIAETFEKRHADVLRDIEDLDCSTGFRERNFALSSYKSEQNKRLPMVLVAQDGFTFMVQHRPTCRHRR